MAGSASDLHFDPEQDYQAIEAALLQSERGRWFLAEHSRRSRRLDNDQIEDALHRLKSSLREPPAMLKRLETELDAVAGLLEDARRVIAARSGHGALAASPPISHGGFLPSLIAAAEELHELIWSSRGARPTPQLCEEIGRRATEMVALGSQQAEVSEQADRFASAIDVVARRVMAALETIRHELGASRHEPCDFSAYALPDPMPLDVFLSRPLAAG
jgi:hypothetical protein